MGTIKVERDLGGIQGLCLIQNTVFGDKRGSFIESYNRRDFEREGLGFDFVQDNQSISVKGTLRGLHYQISFPQTKLIRVAKGKVFDVAVDIRKDSPTCGQWFGIELSDESANQLLIPRGLAHGFLALSEEVVFCYKCDEYYHPNDEGGIAWNSPKLGIQWPSITGYYSGSASSEGYSLLDGTPLCMSEKDQAFLPYEDCER